jgi:predicted dehydrogenase
MIAIYKFPKEVIGKVFCSIGCKRPYTMRTVLYGTKGTIVCDNTNPIIKLYSEQLTSKEILGDSIAFTEIEVPVSNHNFASEVEDFIDSIERKEAFKLNPVEGSKTVLACVSAVESAKKSEKIKIDYDLMLGDVI